MKKLLACVLALVLLLGVGGVAAAAVDEPFDPMAVVAIEAQWNGEISMLTNALTPWFNCDEVTFTVHFDDGRSETVGRYWIVGIVGSYGWSITQRFNSQTNTASFYFWDSAAWSAFIQTIELGPYGVISCEDWDRFHATLISTSFCVPANFVETVINNHRPLKEIAVNVEYPVSDFTIFAFTPERHWRYYINKGFGSLTSWVFVNSDMQRVPTWGSNDVAVEIGFGTYYLIVWGNPDIDTRLVITEAPSSPSFIWWHSFPTWTHWFFRWSQTQPPWLQWILDRVGIGGILILHWVFFGWIWM